MSSQKNCVLAYRFSPLKRKYTSNRTQKFNRSQKSLSQGSYIPFKMIHTVTVNDCVQCGTTKDVIHDSKEAPQKTWSKQFCSHKYETQTSVITLGSFKRSRNASFQRIEYMPFEYSVPCVHTRNINRRENKFLEQKKVGMYTNADIQKTTTSSKLNFTRNEQGEKAAKQKSS